MKYFYVLLILLFSSPALADGLVIASAGGLPANVMFYWDGESTTAQDQSGDVAASATGGTPAFTSACGSTGNGFDSQGTSWVRYTLNSTRIDFQVGTIVVQVSLETEANYDALFDAYVDASNYIYTQTENSSPHFLQTILRGGGTSNYATGSTTNFTATRELRITWDQTANELYVYVDGSEEASELTLTDFTGTTGTLTFGANNAGSNAGDWCIDEFYIYDEVIAP